MALTDEERTLQQELWSKPIFEIFDAWKILEEAGAKRLLCRIDLFYLLVRVCGKTKMVNEFSYERCREVEREPNERLDLWAREHFKSTTITFGKTLQDILIDPEITIGIFSEKFTIASDFLCQLKREMELNEELKRLFPEILWENPKVEAWKWTEHTLIVKRKGNPKEATITAQGMDGLKVGAHYQLMVYDDVITDKSVGNPQMVESITQGFIESLSMGMQGGVRRFIGTRWANWDTYAYIIEKGIAKPRIHTATVDGTPSGKPVLFTQEYWDQKVRDNTPYVLSCQFFLKPQMDGRKLFDITKLRPYDIKPAYVTAYLLCDPGVKTSSAACDTAMLVIGVTKSKDLYLLDGFVHRMTLTERWENYCGLYRKWSVQPGIQKLLCGYETYGNDDLGYFREQMSKGLSPVGTFYIQELQRSLTGSSAKDVRIGRLEPDLRAGKLWVPYDPWATPGGQPSFTTRQQEAMKNNARGALALPIQYQLTDGTVVDVGKVFTKQLDEFPFGRKVDAIDCASRVYDMGIRTPSDLRDKYGSSISVPRKRWAGMGKVDAQRIKPQIGRTLNR